MVAKESESAASASSRVHVEHDSIWWMTEEIRSDKLGDFALHEVTAQITKFIYSSSNTKTSRYDRANAILHSCGGHISVKCAPSRHIAFPVAPVSDSAISYFAFSCIFKHFGQIYW